MEKKQGFFEKLKKGLSKTGGGLFASLFSGDERIDADFYDELEEAMIVADMGMATAGTLLEALKNAVSEQKLKTRTEAREALAGILAGCMRPERAFLPEGEPAVLLIVGVNGVGKTTSIGKMADDMDVSGWYAPAMNIHRSAFAGRNFEYYSEDGVLSGAMAANAIMGSQEQGVYAFMKHFALNDQETNRCGMLCTWSNEQAIREIYLKPFEISVKDADCHAVMSSFNYIGTRWTGGCKELLKNVLRGEWGFVGFVETDYFGVSGYMTADQCVRNGNDLMLCTTGNDFNTVTVLTNSSKQALRESAKNILYTVVNSRAYAEENLNPGMAKWQIVLIGADVLVALLFVTLEVKTLKGYKKRKEEEVNA